jgi:uncharacterized protein (DUF608 family)
MGRRDFLRLAGMGTAAALVAPSWQSAMAGPFSREDFEKLVPADKKLSPQWVRSLFERGIPTVYTKSHDELKYIGMPIGGVCSGQLYLAGDGRLWHWDIFNRKIGTGADHYANPLPVTSPVDQGFALRVNDGAKTQERAMDAAHWKEVTFNGEYPIGRVTYTDSGCPVSASLEAYSPFIPLSVEDSSLPATILEFTIKNTSSSPVEGELGGWLQNAVCLYSGEKRTGLRCNRVARQKEWVFLECTAEELASDNHEGRADIVFEDFESGTYGNWAVTGTAFGNGPVEISQIPTYQGDVGGKGKRVVNSHASAPGETINEKDEATGRLTSRTFTIERKYINFLIGGGNQKGKTCMNLLVDERVILTATGSNSNHMQPMSWEVSQWAGKTAQIVIVDDSSEAWGNIGVDDIVFSDHPAGPVGPLTEEEDFGSMGLALLDAGPDVEVNTVLPTDGVPGGLFSTRAMNGQESRKSFEQKSVGAISVKFKLGPGESKKATFVLAWFFPNLKLNRLPPGRSYGKRFSSARDVAAHVVKEFKRLSDQTRLWHDTWYDSTLPYWFLDRTFLNTSILASSTCYRLGNNRFYSWEGVGCCEGTCGHVWHYAHAMARVFPELERMLREKVDLGLALQPDGAVFFRGEFNNIPAIDAQAGTVLRALREHEMSVDGAFLKANWPRIKRVVEWLIAKDGDGDGLIETNQHNTLDTDWFGPVAWLSGLYLAALLAAEAMAREIGDETFAAQCSKIFGTGQKNLIEKLYDSEYFMNRVDARHTDAINSGTGCEIDQVMGQSWAFQVGLPRVFPKKETLSALASLWRYNFTPDVGGYRKVYKAGRWYAMPGEAGLLMCTFPRRDWDYDQAKGKGPDWAAGYFNECMNGFEYQAAGHMIWEGMVMEGLAVTRAVHDRYHPSRRNPWNEVECGDHYIRSMASYGVYIAGCGYEYHGPQGRLAFAPRITPEDFKACFTAAEGWGTFSQSRQPDSQTHELRMKYGQLRLNKFAFQLASGKKAASITVKTGNETLRQQFQQTADSVEITLQQPAILRAGDVMTIQCGM